MNASSLRRALLPAFAIGIAVLPGPSPAAGEEGEKARRALERILADESSVTEELEALEAEAQEAREAHRAAKEEEARAREELGPVRDAEELAREALAREVERLGPRLVSRYRLLQRGKGLVADDPAEILRLSRAMNRILESDLALLGRARRAQRTHEEARIRLEEAEQLAAARAEDAEARLSELESRLREREALLASIRGERRLLQKVARELEEARRKLTSRVARLERRRGMGFSQGLGRLPWPVEGVVEVPFGKVVNAKFHTVTTHNGLDIRAAEGARVVSVGTGTVAFAGWFRGYGNLVIVDHGEEVHSLYGHLASFDVEVGEKVHMGQRLGEVGDTGSLKGAFLYFELREEGKPIDPLPWLAER